MQLRKSDGNNYIAPVADKTLVTMSVSEVPARWEVVATVKNGLEVAFLIHLLDDVDSSQHIANDAGRRRNSASQILPPLQPGRSGLLNSHT
jgi:hypothetical protein